MAQHDHTSDRSWVVAAGFSWAISRLWLDGPLRRVGPQSSLLHCYYLEGKVTAF